MKLIVDFCLIPLGVGVSLSPYIAECQRIIQSYDLEHKTHAFGTNIEGDWDVVMVAVKQCHEQIHKMGAPRITSTLKIGTRTDIEQSMRDKVSSVESKLI